MATILFAWELGGGYGQLDPIFRLGGGLEAAGHKLHYAVRDLARAELCAAGPGFPSCGPNLRPAQPTLA